MDPSTINTSNMPNTDSGKQTINESTTSSPTPEEFEKLSIWGFTMHGLEEAAINNSAIFGDIPQGLPINTWIMPSVVLGEAEFNGFTMAPITDPGEPPIYEPSMYDSDFEDEEQPLIYMSTIPVSVPEEAEIDTSTMLDIADEQQSNSSVMDDDVSEDTARDDLSMYNTNQEEEEEPEFNDHTMASIELEEDEFDDCSISSISSERSSINTFTMSSISSEQSSIDTFNMSFAGRGQSHDAFSPPPFFPSFGLLEARRWMSQLLAMVTIP